MTPNEFADIDNNIETITGGSREVRPGQQYKCPREGAVARGERNTRPDRKISVRWPRQKEIVFSKLA